MPVPQTRVVILGKKRADKEFTVYTVERNAAKKTEAELVREAERALREIERLNRELRNRGV